MLYIEVFFEQLKQVFVALTHTIFTILNLQATFITLFVSFLNFFLLLPIPVLIAFESVSAQAQIAVSNPKGQLDVISFT